MRKTFRSCMLLINPLRNPHRANRVRRVLSETGFDRIVTSRSRDHFIDLVSEFLKSSSKYLVVWGGDGSIHDTVNTMMREGYARSEKGDKVLGFLRGGSGNGYHDSYEVPRGFFRQIGCLEQCIRERSMLAVDLLKIECGAGTIYGQLAGFGFDAAVAKRRKIAVEGQKGNGRVCWGLLQYVFSTMGAVFHDFNSVKRRYSAELVGKKAIPGLLMNEAHEECLSKENMFCPVMIEVGKRPYYGNKFRICPHAVQNDGKLRVYFFFVSRRITVMRHLFSLWNGKYSKINKKHGSGRTLFVGGYAGDALRLRPDAPVPFHVDGELYEEGEKKFPEFTISVVPAAISFLVPRR